MTLKKVSKLHIYAEIGSASVDRDPDGRNTHRVRQVFLRNSFVLSLLLQQSSELLPRPRKARHESTDRHSHDPGDLLVGKPLEFPKNNYGSEFQKQSLKRLPDSQFRCFPDRVGLRLTVASGTEAALISGGMAFRRNVRKFVRNSPDRRLITKKAQISDRERPMLMRWVI